MAATHNFLMENELLDLDKLDAAVESSRKALSEARESLRGIEQSISDKKSLRKVVNDYRRTRPTIDAHKKLSGRKAENTYRTAKAEYEQLATAKRNAEQILHGTPSRQKKHEQER